MNNKMKLKGIITLISALVMMLALGTLFLWSLFNTPFIKTFGWSKSSVVATFSVALICFCFGTFIGGKFQDKYGPRVVATVGSIVFVTGVLLSGTVTEVWQLYIYMGVLAGLGTGSAYVCPIAACGKWFPAHRGLVTGVIIAFFGLGSVVFKPVVMYYITTVGVPKAFLYLGVIYGIICIVTSQFMFEPQKDESRINTNVVAGVNDKTPLQMFKDKRFYFLGGMYFLGGAACLTIIGLAANIGTDLAKLSVQDAANTVAVLGLFNAFGRVFWGTVSDKLGRETCIIIIYSILACTIGYMGFGNVNSGNFFVIIAITAIAYGGMLTMFPAVVGDYFGPVNFGANYGIVITCYGVGGIIGPIGATIIGLKPTFMLSSAACILCLIGAVTIYRLKKGKRLELVAQN